MELITEITSAFSNVIRPKGDLFIPHEQDEGEDKYFSKKTWDKCTVEDLRYHECALFLFTPEAHTYFLPAFMIASIKYPKNADVIPENILYHFSYYDEPFWQARINILTKEQKSAVSKFLIYMHKEDEFNQLYLDRALHGLESS